MPPHPTDDTSLSLLRRIRADDQLAWQRLVDVYGPLIYSWCARCGLDDHETNDVLQDVFTSVTRNLQQFKKEKAGDTFRGWLRVITRNHIRMHFRKAAQRPQAVGGSTAHVHLQEIADDALDEPQESVGMEYSSLLQRALTLLQAEFEARTWMAFWQTTIDGKSSTEVAATLGMTTGAVRQAKYKVLQRLRNEFGELID